MYLVGLILTGSWTGITLLTPLMNALSLRGRLAFPTPPLSSRPWGYTLAITKKTKSLGTFRPHVVSLVFSYDGSVAEQFPWT